MARVVGDKIQVEDPDYLIARCAKTKLCTSPWERFSNPDITPICACTVVENSARDPVKRILDDHGLWLFPKGDHVVAFAPESQFSEETIAEKLDGVRVRAW